MDRNGFWIFDDNDYSWLFIGTDAEEALEVMKNEHSHDVVLWCYFNGRKWDICDGANPLAEDRVAKMKAWARDHLK